MLGWREENKKAELRLIFQSLNFISKNISLFLQEGSGGFFPASPNQNTE